MGIPTRYPDSDNKGVSALPAPLSKDEFHRLYDGAKPAYEYWHGEAVQKPMPTFLHGVFQFVIALLLENAGWNISLEVRLKVDSDSEPVPDVIALRDECQGPYPTTAPALCIEILSPGDSLAKTVKKAKQYISWGSEGVWIIDPEARTAWTLSQQSSSDPCPITSGGALQLGETAIRLEVLFAEVDKRLTKGKFPKLSVPDRGE